MTSPLNLHMNEMFAKNKKNTTFEVVLLKITEIPMKSPQVLGNPADFHGFPGRWAVFAGSLCRHLLGRWWDAHGGNGAAVLGDAWRGLGGLDGWMAWRRKKDGMKYWIIMVVYIYIHIDIYCLYIHIHRYILIIFSVHPTLNGMWSHTTYINLTILYDERKIPW